MSRKRCWVYILTNVHDTVLYIGMTSGIERRLAEHRASEVEGFSEPYNLVRLVHLEEFGEVEDAIHRGKQLKTWNHSWKEELIRKENPAFTDVSESEASTTNVSSRT